VTIEENMPGRLRSRRCSNATPTGWSPTWKASCGSSWAGWKEKWHARKLEQIFIEERLYKQIEEKINYKAVISTVRQALAPYAEELQRKITTEDVERLLEIKIRRISRYDINRQEKEIREIEKAIKPRSRPT
jgi:topoisomerase IV subunit A